MFVHSLNDHLLQNRRNRDDSGFVSQCLSAKATDRHKGQGEDVEGNKREEKRVPTTHTVPVSHLLMWER